MNKTYRLIWNDLTRTWVAVAEFVRTRGKRASGVVMLAALGIAALPGSASAADPAPTELPSGGQITAGSGSIAQSGANMTVNQSSDKLIANWQSFNIGAQASVTFHQPSAGSIALNRVTSQNPTTILGHLSANGQVMIVNPSGVVFGQGSQVDVGGLVASTLNISDADFLAGNLHFAGNGGGSVLNQGNITTPSGGHVVLIAPVVKNEGAIDTPQGSTTLAAGNQVDIDLNGDGSLVVRVSQGAVDALAENKGLIRAAGGTAILTARAYDTLTRAAVNNSGIVEAKGLSSKGGRIVLDAGGANAGGTVDQQGTLDASGTAGGGKIDIAADTVIGNGDVVATGAVGGDITVSGRALYDSNRYDVSGVSQGGSVTLSAEETLMQTVAGGIKADAAAGDGGSLRVESGGLAYLSGGFSADGGTDGVTGQGGDIAITAPNLILAEAQLTATGSTGGGRVRVGGGWQGNDADLGNARETQMAGGSRIDVSATKAGAGGTAVIWSDEHTATDAAIQATGGAEGGDGGRVEVSSHGQLDYAAVVDVSAPAGSAGQLLLDPKDIKIVGTSPIEQSSRIYINTANAGLGGNGSYELYDLQNTVDTSDDVSWNRVLSIGNNGYGYIFSTTTGGLIGTTMYIGTSPSFTQLYDGGNNAANFAVTTGQYAYLLPGNLSGSINLSSSSYVMRVDLGIWNTALVTPLTNGNAVITATGNDPTKLYIANGSSIGSSTAATAITNSNNISSVTALVDNGNYVLNTSSGAFWMDGTATASPSSSNQIGSAAVSSVTPLANGNFVVLTNNAYAVWGSGAGGTAATSLSTTNAFQVHTSASATGVSVTGLSDGDYVVLDTTGNGSATWGDGSAAGTRLVGSPSTSISLMGAASGDFSKAKVVALTGNGNYVVDVPLADLGGTDRGLVVWGDGADGNCTGGGCTWVGQLATSQGLYGSADNQRVGWQSFGDTNGSYGGSSIDEGVVALSDGNYVVASPYWAPSGGTQRGAATWVDGSNGYIKGGSSVSATPSSSNSLVGQNDYDRVAIGGITALVGNGNYVVKSPYKTFGDGSTSGAATWSDGGSSAIGTVTKSNSLYITATGAGHWGYVAGGYTTPGASLSTSYYSTGKNGVVALSNGNYVVVSPWLEISGLTSSGTYVDQGAVTWVDGATGIPANASSPGTEISSTNSLVAWSTSTGSAYTHYFTGGGGVLALKNGNYAVISPYYNATFGNQDGAISIGSGTRGLTGWYGEKTANDGTVMGTIDAKQIPALNTSNPNYLALANGKLLYVNQLASYSSTGNGVAYLFDLAPVADVSSGSLAFGTNSTGTSYVLASDLLSLLDAGTSVTLQASNDITLSTSLSVNNTSGNGGDLTLQAGRSISLGSNSISTDNGNLTLVANESVASGVVDAQRSSGAATIYSTSSLGTGTGTLSVTLAAGSDKTHYTSGNITLGNISGGNLTVANNGLTTGSDIILGGNITLGANGTGSLNAANGGLSLTGNRTLTVNGGSTLTLGDAVSGSYGITKSGAGTLVMTGANTYTGLTTLNASGGAIDLQGASLAGSLRMKGNTTLKTSTGSSSVAGNVALEATTTAFDVSGGASLTLSGIVSGSGYQLNKNSAGTLILSGPNMYTGGTVINAGTLQIGVGGTSGSLGSGTVNDAGVLVFNRSDSGSSGGVNSIQGTGSVVQQGSGTTTLSGTNTYSGGTVVSGGTLTVSSLSNIGGGNLTLSGGTFNTSANLDLGSRAVTISADSGLSAQSGVTLSNGVFSGSGHTLTLSGGGSFTLNNGSDDFGTVVVSSAKDVTLTDANSLTLGAVSVTGAVSATATDTLTLTGAVATSQTSALNALFLKAARINNTGGSLSVGSGSRWLVWSTNADPFNGTTGDVLGSIDTGYDFKQYGYNGSNLASGSSGNGLLFGYSPAALTPAFSGSVSKVYDGTNTFSGTLGATGAVDSDVVTLSASGSYNSKDVATATTVSASGITISGVKNGTRNVYGYSLASTTASGAGSITPKALTISGLSSQNKVYDGTTAAAVNGTAALQGAIAAGTGSSSDGTPYSGDAVVLAGTAVGSFDSKNVAGATRVSFSGLSLSGADAGDYTLTPPADDTTARITARTVTLSAGKTYDGTTALGAGQVTLGNLAGSETLTYSGATAASKMVADNSTNYITAITLGDATDASGGLAANYRLPTLDRTNAPVTLSKASLTLAAVTDSKTYDGTTASTASVTVSGKAAGDTVTVTQAFASKNVLGSGGSTLQVLPGYTVVDGTSADMRGNYTVALQSASGTISPKVLTVSGLSSQNKVYDGTTAAVVNGAGSFATEAAGSGSTSDGMAYSGDAVNISGVAAGTFSDKNVGSGKLVSISGLALGGSDAANYSLAPGGMSTTADITVRLLTLAWSGQNKLYDGTTAATVLASDDRIGGDVFDISRTANFNDPNPGTGKPVTVSGIGLSGADAGNYALASPTGSTTADIETLPVVNTPTGSSSAGGSFSDPSSPFGGGSTGLPGSDPFNPPVVLISGGTPGLNGGGTNGSGYSSGGPSSSGGGGSSGTSGTGSGGGGSGGGGNSGAAAAQGPSDVGLGSANTSNGGSGSGGGAGTTTSSGGVGTGGNGGSGNTGGGGTGVGTGTTTSSGGVGTGGNGGSGSIGSGGTDGGAGTTTGNGGVGTGGNGGPGNTGSGGTGGGAGTTAGSGGVGTGGNGGAGSSGSDGTDGGAGTKPGSDGVGGNGGPGNSGNSGNGGAGGGTGSTASSDGGGAGDDGGPGDSGHGGTAGGANGGADNAANGGSGGTGKGDASHGGGGTGTGGGNGGEGKQDRAAAGDYGKGGHAGEADAGGGLTLALGNGDRLVDVFVPGFSMDVGEGSVTITAEGAGSVGAGAADVSSSVLPVVSIGADGHLSAGGGVVVTVAGGSVSVEGADESTSDVKGPGVVRRSIEFALSSKDGGHVGFEASLADNGLVIRPRSDLARRLMKTQRDVVIALAIAEVHKQLGKSSDQLQAIYLDFSEVR